MTRTEKLRRSLRFGRERLDALKLRALDAADDVSAALTKRRVPTRRLADIAYAAHMVLAEFWSEARLVDDVTRDLARIKARGRKRAA
jgi:hypothetical protein